MKIKQTGMDQLIISLLVITGIFIATISATAMSAVYSQPVSAETIQPDSGGSSGGTQGSTADGCGGVSTSIIKCNEPGGPGSDIQNSGIWGVLKLGIQIMTAGVGVLAVGGIVWGAILYASAGGSTEQTKKGMAIVKNTVLGLLLYVFMFAIINFLVPGGVLT